MSSVCIMLAYVEHNEILMFKKTCYKTYLDKMLPSTTSQEIILMNNFSFTMFSRLKAHQETLSSSSMTCFSFKQLCNTHQSQRLEYSTVAMLVIVMVSKSFVCKYEQMNLQVLLYSPKESLIAYLHEVLLK